MLSNNNIEQKSDNALSVGFPAGTRVTTDNGLKRIEEIAIGDLVLSKAENGEGEQVFKPVNSVSYAQNKEIWGLSYCIVKKSVKANSLSDFEILNMSRKGKVFGMYVTPYQLFWVKGLGWTRLNVLEQGQLLEMKDLNYFAYVILSNPIYQTDIPKTFAKLDFATYLDVGEYLNDINYTHSQDNPEYNFFKYTDNVGDRETLNDGLNSRSPLFTDEYGEIVVSKNTLLSTVYNLEVSDNHTCYVSDKLWVHCSNEN